MMYHRHFLTAMTVIVMFAWSIPGFAQQRVPVLSPPGSFPSGSVVPAPTPPPFEGVIRPTVDQSTGQWPAQPRAARSAEHSVRDA